MADKQNPKLFFFGFIPRCPYYKLVNLSIIFAYVAFGTWGIYYFNRWVSLGYLLYSILFMFLIMPFTMCRYCYFRTKDETINKEDGKSKEKLVSKEEWSKSGLQKHVGQKNWVWPMTIIWVLPIVLIIISFFKNFNYLASIALVGFIGALVGYFLYVMKVKCKSCPIKEECHSSF